MNTDWLLGNNIFEIAKLLKAHKYLGASLSDAITPSSLAQSRSKLRSNNGHSKGKQKAALENVSYPDDGNERCIKANWCFDAKFCPSFRCLAYWQEVRSYYSNFGNGRVESWI